MAQSLAETATVTRDRAARLAKFLKLLSGPAKTRAALMAKLKTDQRAFYRDLRFLRSLGIEVGADGDKYVLEGPLDSARAKLPCPDPGLTMAEVQTASRQLASAHAPVLGFVVSREAAGRSV